MTRMVALTAEPVAAALGCRRLVTRAFARCPEAAWRGGRGASREQRSANLGPRASLQTAVETTYHHSQQIQRRPTHLRRDPETAPLATHACRVPQLVGRGCGVKAPIALCLLHSARLRVFVRARG